MRVLFGQQATRFGAEWPRTHVLGRVRLAELPEPFLAGEVSSIEALSAVYTGQLSVTGSKSQFPVQGSALSLYMNGMTVFFEDVGGHVTSIQPWLRRFEEEIGMPEGKLRMTAFATRGEKGGLPFHYDGTDNLIVQLAGRKRVHIADNPTVAYPLTQYNAGHALLQEDLLPRRGRPPPSTPKNPKLVVLEPGMALFMPAGMWHTTEHRVESFSLSFVFEWPRAADLVLARLRWEMLQSPAWRRPLYGAWSNEGKIRAEAERQLTATLEGLHASVSRVRAADALVEAPSSSASARYLDLETRFGRAPLTRFAFRRLKNGDSELRIQSRVSFTSTVLEVSADHVPACRWIAARKGQFSLDDLMKETGVTLSVARDLLSTLTLVGTVCRIPFRRGTASSGTRRGDPRRRIRASVR